MEKEETPAVLDDNNTIKSFSVQLPEDIYSYFFTEISREISKRNMSYNFKSIFLEGLALLKKKNPEISYEDAAFKRINRKRNRDKKAVLKATSLLLPKAEINWINNYIEQNIKKDITYSKVNFVFDLVHELKKERKK